MGLSIHKNPLCVRIDRIIDQSDPTGSLIHKIHFVEEPSGLLIHKNPFCVTTKRTMTTQKIDQKILTQVGLQVPAAWPGPIIFADAVSYLFTRYDTDLYISHAYFQN